jgi:fatty-acyl-CoA synthase
MFGSICVALTGITAASTLVLPSVDFQPPQVLEAIEQEQCSALFGAPNFFLSLLEHPDYARRDLASLRTGIMGGAQCPIELMKRVVEQMGLSDILVGYGQTESSSWLTLTRPDDPLDLRVSTVGRALEEVEVKIIDPVSGQETPRGQVGELCGRGFNMKGYFNLPAATARALDPEGWLHTGDMASMDQDGYVRIAGRLKETITKGGDTIFPTEVEELLFTHPGVANAAVFGVPDPKLGEEVAVWIKLTPGGHLSEEDLRAFCGEHLPATHCPRYVKFVQAYPLTAVGKVRKFKMRDQYARELGLE